MMGNDQPFYQDISDIEIYSMSNNMIWMGVFIFEPADYYSIVI